MRGAISLLAILLTVVGCAQLYTPTSKNPAQLWVSVSRAFAVGDQIGLVAVDGVSVDSSRPGGTYWPIDPGTRRLSISYEASKKIVGARVAASQLVVTAKLEAGVKYRLICESSDVGVKAFVRQESNGHTVSTVAESVLIPSPATYPSPPQLLQIPAVRLR